MNFFLEKVGGFMKINLIFFLAIFFSVTTSGFSQSNSSNPILENTMEKKDPEGGKNQLDPDVLKKALNTRLSGSPRRHGNFA